MAPPITEGDNKLLFAIITQLEEKKLITGNLDWQRIADDIGSDAKVKSLQEKWRLFKIKQGVGAGGQSSAADGGDGGSKAGAGKKRGNGNAEGPPKKKAKAAAAPKKKVVKPIEEEVVDDEEGAEVEEGDEDEA